MTILEFLNDNIGLVTLVAAGFAYYIYWQQKQDNKRDAAKIILQEIRRAEEIIADYKQAGSYQFAKKIIATNSWTKNIHFFVGNLNNDELDKISDLYSTGEYLDNLINDISKITLEDDIERDKKLLVEQIKYQQQHPSIILDGSVTYPLAQISQPVNIVIPGIRSVWKPRLDAISFGIEPIYHTTIIGKLKKIAKIN